MPHPDGLPDVFIDRSLGRLQVPRLLRAAGLRLTTLAERYGIPGDEGIIDEVWLAEDGRLGECVFMEDRRVRYNAAEKAAIDRFRVRCFCLSQRNLRAEAMVERYLDNLERITTACADVGGFLYSVHERRIERLDLT